MDADMMRHWGRRDVYDDRRYGDNSDDEEDEEAVKARQLRTRGNLTTITEESSHDLMSNHTDSVSHRVHETEYGECDEGEDNDDDHDDADSASGRFCGVDSGRGVVRGRYSCSKKSRLPRVHTRFSKRNLN